MQHLSGLFWAAFVVAGSLVCCAPSATAEVKAVDSQTPWRAFLVKGGNLVREDGVLRYRRGRDFADITLVPGSRKFRVAWTRGRETVRDEVDLDSPNPWFSPVPPANWPERDFDDAHWARYQPDELADFLGEYGVSVARYVWPTLLCLRTCFGVADPARAKDLKVTVTCLGGGAVYVNGQEVGRELLPAGELHPLTLADDYPAEAYTTEDGHTPLPVLKPIAKLKEAPEPRWLSRYEKRVRTFTLNIPQRVLVKGRNVLAVELHRSAVTGPLSNRGGWSHLGVHRIALTSESGEGVIPYADVAEGVRVWNAGTQEQVANVLAADSLVKGSMFKTLIWVRGMPVKGVQVANPYDPVLPVRMAAPRGGTCSGQTVLSDPGGLQGVSAQLGELKGPRGATIPPAAVQLLFAVQHPAIHYCDALMPDPPKEATTAPVWTVVDVPKGQTPGWYTASLDLAASGKRFSVPVRVLVTGATLPEPKDFTTDISLTQSPDIIARHYEVEPWSPDHWRLVERSLSLAGQLGNDVAYIPVITHNQFRWRLPLVRWVKSDDGLRPEFTLLEKYLDLFEKCCGPPKVVSLYVWDRNCARQVADVKEGRQVPNRTFTPKMPLMVQVLDPESAAVSEIEAPHIVDKDAEQFYKPLIDGVRDIVRDRGWPERCIMIGLGGDIRPSQETGQIIKQWAPYARWNLLSHFSGDPGSHHYHGTMLDQFKAGRLIATGELETGLKEHPYPNNAVCRAYTAMEFEQEVAQPREYVVLPTFRWHWQDYSPPLVFRTAPLLWCRLGRIGIDFWTDDRDFATNTSYFTQISAVTAPGPDGAVPTVRFQMLREGVQDAELRLAIIRAYGKLPEEQRAPYRAMLDEFGRRINGYEGYLSQHELGYDWPGYAARVQEAAAELEGVKAEERWDNPP